MIFKKFEIHHLRPVLKKPFETSFGRFQEKDTVLVKAFTSNGLIGIGESPALPFPYYSYECTDTVITVLTKFILPPLIGKEINTIDELEQSYGKIKGHYMAKTGLEAAFWHLKAQEKNKPLWQLWGGVRQEVEVGISIGLEETPDRVLAKVEKALEKGYRRIKIKIKPGMDIQIAEAVRKKYPQISLMFDANSAYSLTNISLFKELDHYNLLMIEQPLAHDDIIDHAKLQKQIKTAICLDESILTIEDARKAIELGACKIINIKPPRVGGFYRAKKIAEFCESQGVPVWCGGMLETGWGKIFNLHLSTLQNFSLPGDNSGTGEYYQEDIVEPEIKLNPNSLIEIPQDGIGYRINHNLFKKLTVGIIEVKG